MYRSHGSICAIYFAQIARFKKASKDATSLRAFALAFSRLAGEDGSTFSKDLICQLRRWLGMCMCSLVLDRSGDNITKAFRLQLTSNAKQPTTANS